MTISSPTDVDPSRCPLCTGANHCAMVADPDATHCWCFDVTIAAEALERVPAEARGVACVCVDCGKLAKQTRNSR
jgi:hypothetical protein